MKIKKFILPLMAFGVLELCSCSEHDGPSYSSAILKNNELMTILKSKGYTFNQDGKLKLNDLVTNTTSLDLSGTKLNDFTGLDILPNLKEVKLSNNDYGPTFDFSKLPAQITGVDLTGNDIYDYENLVSVKVEENDEETITDLHTLTKLYLPVGAKYNIKDLVRFYRHHKSDIETGKLDMKMADNQGNPQTYNTLREIPDAFVLNYFKKTYSSLMASDGKHIDLAKRLDNKDKLSDFVIYITNAEEAHPASLEGVQYILSNPYWEGNNFTLSVPEKVELPYLEIGDKLQQFLLFKVDVVYGINFENAKNLCRLVLESVAKTSEVDLSKSGLWGQRGVGEDLQDMNGTIIALADCPDLTTLILPKKEVLRACQIEFFRLPKITSINLASFTGIGSLGIGELGSDCKLTYPSVLKEWFDYGGYVPNENLNTSFTCSEDVFSRQETKNFIKRFYIESNPKRLSCSTSYLYADNVEKKAKGVRWRAKKFLDLIK